MFDLDPRRINPVPLAHGSFGTVHAYRDDKDKDSKDWVVKRIYAEDTKSLKFFMQEVVLGFNHRHPCVVSNRGYDIKDSVSKETNPPCKGWDIYIKLPRMEKSFRNLIGEHAKKKTRPPLNDVIRYFYTTAKGLDYLESKSIIHNNVNPGTILIDYENVARIGAIGLAQHKPGKEIAKDLGSPLYFAPERMKRNYVFDKDTAFKGDVWSLALSIIEICLLKIKRYEPQDDDDDDWLLGEGESKPKEEKKISEEEKSKFGTVLVEENLKNLQKEYGKKLGDIEEKPKGLEDLVDILKDALKEDPKDRLSFREICARIKDKFPNLDLKGEISSILNEKFEYKEEYNENGRLIFYGSFTTDYDKESSNITQPSIQSDMTGNKSEPSFEDKLNFND